MGEKREAAGTGARKVELSRPLVRTFSVPPWLRCLFWKKKKTLICPKKLNLSMDLSYSYRHALIKKLNELKDSQPDLAQMLLDQVRAKPAKAPPSSPEPACRLCVARNKGGALLAGWIHPSVFPILCISAACGQCVFLPGCLEDMLVVSMQLLKCDIHFLPSSHSPRSCCLFNMFFSFSDL